MLLGRMLTMMFEAHGLGYWGTINENIDRLQELYEEVENRIEGVE